MVSSGLSVTFPFCRSEFFFVSTLLSSVNGWCFLDCSGVDFPLGSSFHLLCSSGFSESSPVIVVFSSEESADFPPGDLAILVSVNFFESGFDSWVGGWSPEAFLAGSALVMLLTLTFSSGISFINLPEGIDI